MLKLQDLVDALVLHSNVKDVSFACGRVLSDVNFLILKPRIGSAEWVAAYVDAHGESPSRELFESHSMAAIARVKELVGFGKLVDSCETGLPQFPADAAGALLQKLTNYRNSIGSYWV